MARFSSIQNALTGGEVTHLARGRSDAPQYKNSLEDLKNMIPFAAGGAARRPGTTYLNKVGTSGGQLNLGNAVDRMIPWELSNGSRYMVCLGGSAAIKVINLNTNALMTVTNASAYAYSGTRTIGTITTTEATNAQFCQIGDYLVITCGGTAPHFILQYYPVGGSEGIYMYGPWDEFLINYHPVSGVTYALSTAQKNQRSPFLAVNVSGNTLASSSTTGDVTVTASVALFSSTHVGAWLKFGTGAILITSYTSGTSVDGHVYDTLASAAATTTWEEGAWSDYQGWPRTVSFFNNRLVFGGSTKSPDTLWFSQDGDPQEMSLIIGGSTADTDAFAVSPNNAEKVSQINWMVGGNNFAFGTGREEFTVSIPDSSAGFSVSNIQITKQTSRGSKYVQAVRFDSAVYFVDPSGQRVVEFVFDLRENNYRGRDINIFADHMFAKFQELHSSPRAEKSIISMCRQSDKDQRLWVLDEAGGLFSCVIDRSYEINAWSMHYLGGNGLDGDTDPAPFVRSIASLNNENFPTSVSYGHDILWLSTGRTINSSFDNFIEYMDRSVEDENDYLDFKKTTTQSSSTSVTGLSYLEGETVSVVADGNFIGSKTVSSGAITLSLAATSIITGLPYKSRIKTLPVEAGSQIGSSLSAIGRIDQAKIHFNRSANASVGSVEQDDDSNLDEITFRPASVATSLPIPLFSGYKVIELGQDYERERQIVIETSDPLAMTVTHIVFRGQEYD